MKLNKIKTKKYKFWQHGMVFLLLLTVIGLSGAIAFPKLVNAQPARPDEIRVADEGERGISTGILLDRWGIYISELAERNAIRAKDAVEASVFKTTLQFVFNTLAYDLATWIATIGEGQQPAFITEGWGPYLANVADGASGFFLESLGKTDWGKSLNVCNPNIDLKIKIGIALGESRRPVAPNCTINKAIQKWDEFLDDADFLNNFSAEFSPKQNDIVGALTVFDREIDFRTKKEDEATRIREEGQGYDPLTESISGQIKTPGQLVKDTAKKLPDLGLGAFPEQVFTNDIVADAVGIFGQTLATKVLKRALSEGVAFVKGLGKDDLKTNSGIFGDKDLFSSDSSQSLYKGKEAAESRFSTFLDAGIVSGGPYEILRTLSTCTDVNNPSIDQCVVDQDLRFAIEREMTVREAIENGRIDGNAPFGYISKNFEPSYTEGYPYRSLLILRTHRVLPVTWELAATIINEGFDRLAAGQVGTEQQTYTLNQLIAEFDNVNSPFYKLIDQDWVLKAPESFCAAEGNGPILTSETNVGDLKRVSRQTYCADYETCLEKDAEGNCIFGHCTEESRVWNLQGESCPVQFNTCQTFESRTGNVGAYLKNTLEYNGCDSTNVGCQWFCQEYNTINGVWTCVEGSEQVLKECSQPGGCPLSAQCEIDLGGFFCQDPVNGISLDITSACDPGSKFWTGEACDIEAACSVEQGGVSCTKTGCESFSNLLPNPSFEIGSFDNLAQSWNWNDQVNGPAYFEKVSGDKEQVFGGNSSIRFFSNGANVDQSMSSEEISLPAGSYSFSTMIFNNLNKGDITFSVYKNNNPSPVSTRSYNEVFFNASLFKNRWQVLSADDIDISTGDTVRLEIRVASDPLQVSGSAWFDDFRISESCIVSPVTLTLTGAVEKDESKIHFDRDLQLCDPESDGCSLFLTANEGVANDMPGVNNFNLISNAGFESQNPSAWFDFKPGVLVEREQSDTHSGFSAAKLTSLNENDRWASKVVDTQRSLKDRAFIASIWAKVDSNNSTELLHNNAFFSNLVRSVDNPENGFTFNMDHSVAEGKSIDTTWRRFAVPVVFETEGNKIEFALRPSKNLSGYVLYDDLQLEEIDLARSVPQIVRDVNTRDECLVQGRGDLPYAVWFNDTCWNIDVKTLLTRQSINIRQAPDYLECRGYSVERPSPFVLSGVSKSQCDAGTNLIWDATSCVDGSCCHEIDPPECGNYAPYCFEDEVGCEAYLPVLGGPAVPGVASFEDLCPNECIGYESYKQSPTAFETQETLEYFIPDTAQACNIASAGCDEFTDLEQASEGGEATASFTYLRQCALPSDPSSGCSNFFAWEGSDESGFQLKSYTLSTEPGSTAPKEAITDVERQPEFWGECNNATDARNNPFCRELFDSNGATHYKILNNTVTCSDNCHSFRKTRLGESDQVAGENCNATGGVWDGSACTYKAIPGEGLSCAAAATGCREYRGNTGANVFTAFKDDFEDGQTVGWSTGIISNVALSVGGHSIKTQDGVIETSVADLGRLCSPSVGACSGPTDIGCYEVLSGKCRAQLEGSTEACLVDNGEQYCSALKGKIKSDSFYSISFWARSFSGGLEPSSISLFKPDSGNSLPIANFLTKPEWSFYTFGPFNYAEADSGTQLVLSAFSEKDLFVDNIEIKEIKDYVYVVKNSWSTPQVCDQNPFVDPPVQANQFMLGCKEYQSLNRNVALKSFDHLCREEVVSCRAMVDTQNSASPYAQNFNQGDEIGFVGVPADEIKYIVTRPEFQCGSEAKGCQQLGLPEIDQDDNIVGYKNVFALNDPDSYSSSLCGSPEVMCEEFRTGNGFEYFKTPRDRFCEYRQTPGSNTFGWYRFGSSASAPDCPVVRSPLGTVHPDGSDNWVGICPIEFSTCSEFVDPVSSVATNELFNVDFSQDVDGNSIPDGWNLRTDETNRLEQDLRLKPSTLYTLSVEGTRALINSGSLDDLSVHVVCSDITSFDNSLKNICVDVSGVRGSGPLTCQTDSDCDAGSTCRGMQLPPEVYEQDIDLRTDFGLPDERAYSGRFFIPHTFSPVAECKVVVELEDASNLRERAQQLFREVTVRETGVYYQLKNTVDRQSCNGVVNEQDNCVLFNDRSEVNYKIGEEDTSYLIADADVSGVPVNNGVPVIECAGTCDSNSVLKVRPSRICGEWLECRTKIKAFDRNGNEQDFCIELAACDSFDEVGNCNNFVLPDSQRVNSFVGDIDGDGDAEPLLNATVYQQDHQRLANLSGYSKAGSTLASFTSIGGEPFETQNTIDGFYPYNAMEQTGEVGRVFNGDFEEIGVAQYPVGWEPEEPSGLRDSFRFKVVRPGAEAINKEGIKVLGNGSLKITANNVLVSEPINVFPNSVYAIAGSINSINLQPENAQAVIDVIDMDGNSLLIDGDGESTIITQNSRSLPEWQNKNEIFNSLGNSLVRVKLFNVSEDLQDLGGASYYDNIDLAPVLKVNDVLQSSGDPAVSAQWESNYVNRSCRIYPEQDSLSCRYVDDNGVQQRGWSGYCLEHDPANPDSCLQWYPVDLIHGDLFGQFPGYQDRSPQYYCAKMADEPISIISGNTGRQRLEGGDGGPWVGQFTMNTAGLFGQPNFIEVAESKSFKGSGFNFGKLRLDSQNNWEVGWITEYTDSQNLNYTDLDSKWNDYLFEVGHDYCEYAGDTVIFNEGEEDEEVYICEDNRPFSSENRGIRANTKMPDRLLEQKVVAKKGYTLGDVGIGLGPEYYTCGKFSDFPGASCDKGDHDICWEDGDAGTDDTCQERHDRLNGVQRAKAAIQDKDYCKLGYAKGLDPDKKTIIWLKANFDDAGLFQSIDYGACDNTSDRGDFEWEFIFHYAWCEDVVQVVSPTGQNKAWLARVSEGSQYVVDTLGYPFDQDYKPFGAIVYPEPSYDPSQWDAKSDTDDNPSTTNDDNLYIGNQPLFLEAPETDVFDPPYQVRAGNPYSCAGFAPLEDADTAVDCILSDRKIITLPSVSEGLARLKRIFAQSYGAWKWRNISDTETFVERRCTEATPFEGLICNIDTNCWPEGHEDVPVGSCQAVTAKYVKIPTSQGVCDLDGNLCESDADCPDIGVVAPLSQKCTSFNWEPPNQLCLDNQRPKNFNESACEAGDPLCDYCAVAPLVKNIKINSKATGEVLAINTSGSSSVDLEFNAVINPEQLPLSSYRIDWGDRLDSVSGISLRDRSDQSSPYRFSHGYSYYELLAKNKADDRIFCESEGPAQNLCSDTDAYCTSNDDCGSGSCGRVLPANTCAVQPRIQIIDNWGWCNGNIDQVDGTIYDRSGYSARGASGETCFDSNDNAWTYYPGLIIVGVGQQ